MHQTKFTNEFSKEIYDLTYRIDNETIDDTFNRIATHISSIEKDKEYWKEQFNFILQDFKFVPGGRIFNAGSKFKGTTFINCFVSGFQGKNQDSMESIMDELKRQALILKSEGGYGVCFDVLRPRNSVIDGIGSTSPGVVEMMDMWNTQSDVITKGSGKDNNDKGLKKKIRKGAMLGALSVWHADIEEFITIKQTPGKLTKFNLSVAITDDFITAVKNKLPWNLEFPDFNSSEKIKQIYDSTWDGNLKKWKEQGLPVKIYKTYSDANELWNLIMKSTYNRNEPGVLFIDRINELNNLNYCEYINATNPCVVGDTLVLTNYGWFKIKNLEEYKTKYSDLKIITRNKKGKLFESELKWVGITKKLDKIYELEFSNSGILRVNNKHKLYNSDFKEIKAIDCLNEEIITFRGTVKCIKVTDLNINEEVWDLTANPNYNFYSLYGEEELYCKYKPESCFTENTKEFEKHADYCYKSILSVDCGEQALPVGGSCLLGSINLTQFINSDKTNWDYDKLKQIIPIAVRFMDNVNDLSYVPLKIQQENLKNKRRIGLGIMGYASALLIMKIKYGSKHALELTEQLMSFFKEHSYLASVELAKEKGVFPLFDSEKYLQSKNLNNLPDHIKQQIKEHGIRNSHLISIQPTGNSAIAANCVSNGIEPIFLFEYKRTFIIPYPPVGLNIPINIDWKNKTYNCIQKWEWIKEGDENMLSITYNNIVYKLDENRGLTKETMVLDYGVNYLKSINEWDSTKEWCSNTNNLTVDDHVNTLKVLSKYVCASISKTITLPENYSFEDFKTSYIKLYDSGTIKGGTTYRIGTMASVMSDSTVNKKQVRNGHIVRHSAPKRPPVLPCDVHQIVCKKIQWTIFVGKLQDEDNELSPYEIFAFKKKNIILPNKIKTGKMIKVKSGIYNFEAEDGLILENIIDFFDKDEQEALTRAISLGLRHGAHIKYVVEQLNKSEGDIQAFSRAISRVLKKYIKDNEIPSNNKCPECKKDALIYTEGCVKCTQCGYSACS